VDESETQNSHRHGECSLFRVFAGERHPGDVERMRKGPECLCPDYPKVSYAAQVDLGEDAVENVAEEMQAHTSNNGLSTLGAIQKELISVDSKLSEVQ
jgi:hypothetical protein